MLGDLQQKQPEFKIARVGSSTATPRSAKRHEAASCPAKDPTGCLAEDHLREALAKAPTFLQLSLGLGFGSEASLKRRPGGFG